MCYYESTTVDLWMFSLWGRAGRSSSMKWFGTRTTIASPFATWKTSIPWVSIQGNRLSSPHHRPWATTSTTGCGNVLWRSFGTWVTWQSNLCIPSLLVLLSATSTISTLGWDSWGSNNKKMAKKQWVSTVVLVWVLWIHGSRFRHRGWVQHPIRRRPSQLGVPHHWGERSSLSKQCTGLKGGSNQID